MLIIIITNLYKYYHNKSLSVLVTLYKKRDIITLFTITLLTIKSINNIIFYIIAESSYPIYFNSCSQLAEYLILN